MADLARYVALHGLDDLLESTRTCVALVDSTGEFLIANPAFRVLMETVPAAAKAPELVAPAQAGALSAALKNPASGVPHRLHLDIHCGSGFAAYDCVCIRLASGESVLIAERSLDDSGSVDDQLHLREQLEDARSALAFKTVELQSIIAQADEVSHTDALTLLPNRRLIIAEFQREVLRSERYGSTLAVSMLDLDNFKVVNDTFGHGTGDDVLRTVSRELRLHIRQPDEIGRYGGDEFLVILPSSTAAAAAEQASRLCRQIRALDIVVRGERALVTLSVGIAQLKTHGENWQSLLERADRALYVAKAAGGDQWKVSEN